MLNYLIFVNNFSNIQIKKTSYLVNSIVKLIYSIIKKGVIKIATKVDLKKQKESKADACIQQLKKHTQHNVESDTSMQLLDINKQKTIASTLNPKSHDKKTGKMKKLILSFLLKLSKIDEWLQNLLGSNGLKLGTKVIRSVFWLPFIILFFLLGITILNGLDFTFRTQLLHFMTWISVLIIVFYILGLAIAMLVFLAGKKISESKQNFNSAYLVNMTVVTVLLILLAILFSSLDDAAIISENTSGLIIIISLIIAPIVDAFVCKTIKFVSLHPSLGNSLAAAIIGAFGTIIAAIFKM